jgi:hypothetical protein
MNNEDIDRISLKNWPMPDSYLLELGRLSGAWAILESSLEIYLGKVSGFDDFNDPTPFILTKHSSFPQKLDMLAALCEHLLPNHPGLADYRSVVSDLRSAQTSRNRFIHNGMSLNPESGNVEMARGSARGSVKVSVEKVELADIKRASMDVHKASLRLHGLVTGQHRPPIWDRPDA